MMTTTILRHGRKVRVLLLTLVLTGVLLLSAIPAAAQQTYTVQPGDTLTRIARLFNTTVDALRQANGIAGDYIAPGEVLVIPAQGGPSTPVNTVSYTVRSGDSLSTIAALFGTTVQAIQAQNSLGGTAIVPGQVLQVPAPQGTPVQPPATTPPTAGGTYTVQPGDQLRFIAARFGTTWQAIAQLNGLPNPNVIFPGQVLLIPGTGGPVVQPPVVQPPASPPVIQPQPVQPVLTNGRYIVRAGDTLLAIARAFRVDVFNIARVNGIYNLNRIFTGQALFIPGYSF